MRTPHMIVRTDAVVLRTLDYSETSLIVQLLTRQHGRIAVMAKGARRPKSKFGATLQPMSYVQVVYYHKPNRGLQTLTEAAHVQRFPHLTKDLDRLTVGLRLVEFAHAVLEEGEPNAPALGLLLQALAFTDGAPAPAPSGPAAAPANALPWLQLHYASLLGFAPDLDRERLDRIPETGGVLVLSTGAAAPSEEAAGVAASRAALRAFAVFARAPLSTAGRMRLTPAVRQETESLTDAFLRHHTERLPTRVARVTSQLGRTHSSH